MSKNAVFKKGFVVTVIVLFAGLSIIPTISGNTTTIMHKECLDFMDCIEDRSVVPRNLGGGILWGWWWPDFPGRFEPFFNVEEIYDFVSGAVGLTSADFNDDGLLDCAVAWGMPFDGQFHANISILYNNGLNNDFTREDVFSINYSRFMDLDSADYDGDGDIDLLYTYSRSEGAINKQGVGRVVFNNGEGVFNEEQLAFYHEYNPGRKRINPQVSSADFDNDGDIDFIVGDNSGLVAFYKNDGTGNFIHAGDSDFEDMTISWGVANADFDNDGDIDFIVTESINNDIGNIYLKYNIMTVRVVVLIIQII